MGPPLKAAENVGTAELDRGGTIEPQWGRR